MDERGVPFTIALHPPGLSDSMIRKIRRQDINREAPQVKTSIKTFPGATMEQMKSYNRPTIEEDPDGLFAAQITYDRPLQRK